MPRRSVSRPIGILILLLVLTALPGRWAHARTWHVEVNGSGDAPTIQAAVDSAAAGDVILVGPGRYTWANQGGGDPDYAMITILRGQNGFTIRSATGPGSTILDAQHNGRVMFIQGLNGITVEGFTMTGGEAPVTGYQAGGALWVHLSSDVVRNCVFVDNHAQTGAGIWCGGVSTFTVEDCEFRDNVATSGAAIFFINSTTGQTVRGCLIEDNTASSNGGAIYASTNQLTIENTIIFRNEAGAAGGAIYMRSMLPSSMTGCTLVQNYSLDGGAIYANDAPSFALDRSIIAFQGGAALVAYSGSVITTSCSDIYGNSGGDALPGGSIDAGGNFSLDPVFCSLGALDFSLDSSSPCAPGNHPDGIPCELVGARGVNCGQVQTERRSWGAVKALYLE